MNSQTFGTEKINYLKSSSFFGEPVNIARYDIQKYPQIEKLVEKQLGFYWRETEVDLSKDSKDFKTLTDHEKHIFISNIRRQIILDSVQGRAPVLSFLPVTSLPELENWFLAWSFFESIHSRSYTHIIRNLYPNPSEVFDGILDIQEIVDCARDISKYYDELNTMAGYYNLLGLGKHTVNGQEIDINLYDLKKALWMALNSVNALEGVRFYVSFACSWAFGELKKMEGNAKIIKLIARDENVHLASTQQLLKLLAKEDDDFAKIAKECEPLVWEIFQQVAEQEKNWAKYLFRDGSIIGLNLEILCDYVEYITNRRLLNLGYPKMFKNVNDNPLGWTLKWIGGGKEEVQVAPQETEISSYLTGAIKKDVTSDTFNGLSL